MALKRAKLNCTEGWMPFCENHLLCSVCERENEIQARTFYKGKILVIFSLACVYVYGGGGDGKRTWLTMWISARCKSASVTDGRPLIAGVWRLGSGRRRKSLSAGRPGWEGEGWGCLGCHHSSGHRGLGVKGQRLVSESVTLLLLRTPGALASRT